MDSRKLAALLSSLISQLLLLLFLIAPPPISLSLASDSKSNIFPLLHHFLSSQQFVAALSLLQLSRKRKRTHLLELESDDEIENRVIDGRFKLGFGKNPDFFRDCFKMNSSTFDWLSGLLEPLLECRDPLGSPLNLPPELRLGLGLFRLATGSDYSKIARRFGVPETAARFCAKQLCRVLCTNFRFWVGFPSPGELESVSEGFEDLTGLPNCCGVIDCIRFRIDKNGSENTIAAQIVVDSESRILSIVAGFRSHKSDWEVLKSSSLYKDVKGGTLLSSSHVDVNEVSVNQYLVGHGGYPLLPWLMVPFVDAIPGSCEVNFNAAHGLMRDTARRTIASLKNWGVLSRPIQEEFKTAVGYIGACSILHNVLLMRKDYSALSDGLGDEALRDQTSRGFYDASFEEEETIRTKSFIVRSALATRAKELC